MGRGQRRKKTNKGRQAFAPVSASGDASTPQAPERYAAIYHKRHGWIDAPEGGYFEPSDSGKIIEMYDPALEAEGLWGTNADGTKFRRHLTWHARSILNTVPLGSGAPDANEVADGEEPTVPEVVDVDHPDAFKPGVLTVISGRQINAVLAQHPSPTKLLTKELERKLPPIGAYDELVGEEFDAQPAIVKYFTPAGGWTWFALEYDPAQRIFWGYVESGLDPSFDEFGSFSLDELAGMGAVIERDLYFDPTPIGEIRANRGRF